jgi:hypothetical protein
VFKDYLAERDDQLIAEIIREFEAPLSHEIMTLLLSLVWRKSGIIQKALRDVISRLIFDGYSVEIRNILLEYLKHGITSPGPLVKEPGFLTS